MTNKINNILLIDDSPADNFISNRIINKAAVAETVTTTFGAREALDYLTTPVNGQLPKPEIIFLDINMPGMSGWEFLDELMLLDKVQKTGITICMLTTSKSDIDKEKAFQYDSVQYFLNKPLSEEKLSTLIKQHI